MEPFMELALPPNDMNAKAKRLLKCIWHDQIYSKEIIDEFPYHYLQSYHEGDDHALIPLPSLFPYMLVFF